MEKWGAAVAGENDSSVSTAGVGRANHRPLESQGLLCFPARLDEIQKVDAVHVSDWGGGRGQGGVCITVQTGG